MKTLALALRLLRRDWRAGELTLLAAAVIVAVAAVTTVGFFAQRVYAALDRQSGVLIGADLFVAADRPLDRSIEDAARTRGLAVTHVLRFPSMVVQGGRNLLADVKPVGAGYPLRGELRIADAPNAVDRTADGLPAPGTLWADERLFQQLGVERGATVMLGGQPFVLDAVITQEPDAGIGFLNAAPRVLMNRQDLAATGLEQPGSRIRYRLLVAGEAWAVDAFRAAVTPLLQPGMRLEGVRDARPEVRSALERAERFLSLAALVSVIVAAAGTALAARRFVQRHLDATAVMRCLGMTRRRMVAVFALQLAVLGILASLAGVLIGIAAQALLASWLGTLVPVALPAPGVLPAVQGLVTGIALLLGFAVPPLAALGGITPLRVLRRDLRVPGGGGIAGYALGFAIIVALVFWRAGEAKLGAWVIAGFSALALGGAIAALLVLQALSGLKQAGVSWRFGIANLQRRRLGAVVQVVALALGIMALLTLTVIRGDLLAAWQRTLPADAPNRFLVNILPEQVSEVAGHFRERGGIAPVLHPMVRGRLVAINDAPVSAAQYDDERARRLVDREFNLSWSERLRADNQLVAGRWWSARDARDQLSLELGIAQTLGLKLGDRLTFDVAGKSIAVTITSLRKVDWDSFNVNFFAVVPPGLLDREPATYVTSFHLAAGDRSVLDGLLQRFPNVLVIDVAQVIGQVQRMMDQVARAVQFVFLFTVLAGLVVLYAAIASAQDERLHQATIMRMLGASRAQLARATLAEFLAIGGAAGLLGAAGATALGYVLATRVLHFEYGFSATVWLVGGFGGALAVALAGHLGTRRVLRVRPLDMLRSLA